jgi:hypothetical protein
MDRLSYPHFIRTTHNTLAIGCDILCQPDTYLFI